MDITINLRKLVAEIDIAKIKEEYLKDIIGKRNNNKYNLFFNNIKLQKLKKCLETELKIEKRLLQQIGTLNNSYRRQYIVFLVIAFLRCLNILDTLIKN